MIDVDPYLEKNLRYTISDINKVKSANFILLLPNNVVHAINGFIHEKSNSIIVKLPPLKNILKDKKEVECYLEICDVNDVYHKLSYDTIVVKDNSMSISLKFSSSESKIQSTLNSRSEIFIDSLQIKKNAVKKKEYPRRSELLL